MMRVFVVLYVVTLCVGPGSSAWGKPKLTSSTTTITPTVSRMGAERRVVKADEEKDYEDEGGGSIELDGIESTIINGTEQEERFHHKFPLHIFMKKKRPFVSFSTVTQTSTVTALITSSTVGLCAKLVNVTGPCRLRRGLWEEDPIVLSFEDDMESIDEALSPSKTFSIETTAMPEDVDQERSGDLNSNRNKRISVRSGSVISSSKDEGESKDDDEGTEGRFGFFGLKKKFKKKIKFITVITTTVVTSTSTSTYYVTISTKTFFIQLCTPSPFPFNICIGRKKRLAELEEPAGASNQKS